MATWVGIKVERFALGFGPRLVGFVRGETDYCVKLLPLGGYVKMAGQEDFRPLKEQETIDPRSFNAKPVWARLLVVSAGVVMNIVFAAVLFVVVCVVGIRFPAPRVGGVAPGSPAEEAGLKPGDAMLELNGREISNFNRLQVAAALADAGETFDIKIERDLDGRKFVGILKVGVKGFKTERGGERFMFGIAPASSLVFADFEDSFADSGIKPQDKLVKIAGRPVEHSWQIDEAAKQLMPSKPSDRLPDKVQVTVERAGRQLSFDVPVTLRLDRVFFHAGRWARWWSAEDDTEKGVCRITLPDKTEQTYSREDVLLDGHVVLSFLGMSPRLKIFGVAQGSPAEDAGLKVGDVIVSYADQRNITHRRLLELNAQNVKQRTSIVIEQAGQLEQKWIRPTRRNGRELIGLNNYPDLGNPIVGAVQSGSPAAKANIRPGDRIARIVGRGGGGEATREIRNWIDVFNSLCEFRGREVTVQFEGGRRIPVPKLDEALFDPQIYRADLVLPPLEGLMGPMVRKNPLAAVAWGTGQTYEFIIMTYATLRGWLKGSISHKEFAGPVGISRLAILVGRKSVVELVYFMAMIAVSVAVVNFLPFPVFDGGLAVFLLIEKLRGKPVPLKIMNIAQMIGLALILFAFVALTWNDIVRWVGSVW